jgi:GNAT superfamily N-acetyltransferase
MMADVPRSVRADGVGIAPAATGDDIAAFARLCRDYAASLPFSLEYQGFEAEMASLPGRYAAPGGVILLAWRESRGGEGSGGEGGGGEGSGGVGDSARASPRREAIACVAVRPIAPDGVLPGDLEPVCELKRMWVAPSARGQGIGHALMAHAIAFARGAGYRMMKLDTSPDMHAAIACYARAGFTPAPRYNDDVDPTTMYFALVMG